MSNESVQPIASGLASETEKAVAEVWSAVLTKEISSSDDDFFEVGGNSMLATLAIYQLRERFDIEMPLMLIFENPTIAELAQAIDELAQGDGAEVGEGAAPLAQPDGEGAPDDR